MANQWVCEVCGKLHENEVDLLAHQFNSDCEKELAKRQSTEQGVAAELLSPQAKQSIATPPPEANITKIYKP